MLKIIVLLLGLAGGAAAEEERPANALLLAASEATAYDARFQKFLDAGGARLVRSFPPSAFIGHVPEKLDKELAERFGVRVYRGHVADMADFFKAGPSGVMAVNAWNKQLQQDPPAAPAVVSHQVGRSGQSKLVLRWNQVMKAAAYRLQVAAAGDFAAPLVDTRVEANSYELYTPFLSDGVHYWRVAPLLRLNTGGYRQGDYSEAYTFPVARYRQKSLPLAVELPLAADFAGGRISWPAREPFRYYRLQVSAEEDFLLPDADVFVSTPACAAAGLGLDANRRYYMRVQGADDEAAGRWSNHSEITLAPGPGLLKAAKKKRRK